ncbi:MAG TPA: hypothetical protein VNA20_12075 [Frankiaceae bacterium]|nr:hypothetical protein [Frankiaceae bacterium]
MPKPFVRVALTASVVAAVLGVAAGPVAAEEWTPPEVNVIVRDCYAVETDGDERASVCP